MTTDGHSFERPMTPREQFESVRWQLEHAVQDDDLVGIASLTGPLKLSDIPDSFRSSDVLTVAAIYAWPDDSDTSIVPVESYEETEFIDQLFSAKNRIQDKKALNNFRLYLRATPIEDISSVDRLEDSYGLEPVVHRANALAPELFAALRLSTRAFPLGEARYARDFLLEDDNIDIRVAYYIAYRIMGRLLKTSDRPIPIADAHQALTD